MKFPAVTSTADLVQPTSRLSRAILASLLLHLFALLGLHQLRESLVASSPMALRAELRPVLSVPLISQAPSDLQPLVTATRQTKLVPRQSPVVGVASVSPERRAAEVSEVAVQAAVNRTSTVQFTPPPAKTAEVAAVPSAQVDGEELSRYRLDVARQAKRYKRYPLLARERGWAGRSEVLLSLGPNSELPDVALEKTSGYPLLDEQAVEMILQASRAAKVPPGLQRRSISIVLPVVFDLDE